MQLIASINDGTLLLTSFPASAGAAIMLFSARCNVQPSYWVHTYDRPNRLFDSRPMNSCHQQRGKIGPKGNSYFTFMLRVVVASGTNFILHRFRPAMAEPTCILFFFYHPIYYMDVSSTAEIFADSGSQTRPYSPPT